MSTIFFDIKRGSRLSLKVTSGRSEHNPLVSSPRFFFSSPKDSLMNILPAYKDVPFIQEKLKNLKLLIDCDRSAIALWEAKMPKYELLPKVKEQLARNEKLLLEITGTQPCQ